MPTILVSFLGKGLKERPDSPRSGYLKTRYDFSAVWPGAAVRETSLFGAALLEHLRADRREDVTRWLVLGTSASLWSELRLGLADPDADRHCDPYFAIDERVVAQTADPAALAAWEAYLNQEAHGRLNFWLVLTGAGLTSESQNAICRALFDHVPEESDVAFDISHGFRHQPVLAAFAIGLMRRTHRLRRADFYSGVWEARDRESGNAPVLRLDLCPRLLQMTESAAVLNIVGNYAPLAHQAGLKAADPWFFESTHQLGRARAGIELLQSEVRRQEGASDALEAQAAKLLAKHLASAAATDLTGRFYARARQALAVKNYMTAIVLCYEMLLLQEIQSAAPGSNEMNYSSRKAARDRLQHRLHGEDRKVFRLVREVRNACAHGCRPDRSDARQVLGNRKLFVKLVEDAIDLFDRLAGPNTVP